jgi:hypothetical protein
MKIERLRSRFAGANQGQTQTNVQSDLPPAATIHLFDYHRRHEQPLFAIATTTARVSRRDDDIGEKELIDQVAQAPH